MSTLRYKRCAVLFAAFVLLGSVSATVSHADSSLSVSQSSPAQNAIRNITQQLLSPLGLDGSFSSDSQAAQTSTPLEVINETGPPLQRAIKDALALLAAEGKPVPAANFTKPTVSIPEFGNTITIMAKTVLNFTGPAEAGKLRWDDLIVNTPTSGIGTITETGNFTQRAINKFPGVYGPGPCGGPGGKCFTYGTEPRVYTIPENFTAQIAPSPRITAPQSLNTQDPTTTGNVLMGFSFARNIDWSIGSEACVDLGFFGTFCLYKVKVGFTLDYGIGLRLPASVDINRPASMVVQHTYSTLTTSLTPLDFSPSDYGNIGLPADQIFNGHEFEARFKVFLGIVAEVVGVGIDWSISPNVDLGQACTNLLVAQGLGTSCQDFVTPFGNDKNGNPIQFPFNGVAVTLTADQTGISYDFAGAGLGVGLGVTFSLGPASRITADWSASGAASGSGTITYTAASPTQYNLGTITTNAANMPGQDNALITLQNFRYFFSTLTLGFCADLGFTGWLSFVGSTPCKDLFTFTLDISDLSLHQHDGTRGVTATVPVQDFALDLSVSPSTIDIVPGSTGTYDVTVTNKGTGTDTFDTFKVTGLPSSWNPPTFVPNTASLGPGSSATIHLGITPLRNFATAPGNYPFTVIAQSAGATMNGLTRTASASATVHVLTFHDPLVEIVPSSHQVNPGQTASYTINVQNNGNAMDSIDLSVTYLDFGTLYRAVPTVIQPSWATLGSMHFGPLSPGQKGTTTLVITVPATWQGAQNAVYMFKATVTSSADPTVHASKTGDLTVVASKASITRFIDGEINSLSHDVSVSSIPSGLNSALSSKLSNAEAKKEAGLANILAGNLGLANNELTSASNSIGAFVSQVTAHSGKDIPTTLAASWISQAQTIMNDIQAALAAN